MRPQRGSRATSKIGASAWWAPIARSWRAKLEASASSSPGSQAAASPIDCGKHTASRATRPCRHSSWTIAGMPSRVSSTRKRWISLASAAAARHGEVGRPGHARDLADAGAEARAGLVGVDVLAGQDLEDPDRADLGELLLERHPRQEVVDAVGDGQRRVEIGGGRDAQPLTAPLVSPPMSWRSANA